MCVAETVNRLGKSSARFVGHNGKCFEFLEEKIYTPYPTNPDVSGSSGNALPAVMFGKSLIWTKRCNRYSSHRESTQFHPETDMSLRKYRPTITVWEAFGGKIPAANQHTGRTPHHNSRLI